MNLQRTLALTLAVLAAVVVLVFGTLAYATIANEIHIEIDATIQAAAQEVAGHADPDDIFDAPGGDPDFGTSSLVTLQRIKPDGSTVTLNNRAPFPVTPVELEMATRPTRVVADPRDVVAPAGHYRIVTVAIGGGVGAIQVGRNLRVVDSLLDVVRVQILLVGAVTLAVAAAAGWFVASRIARRLVDLTRAAEEAGAGHLDLVVPEGGSDEVGRLGKAFNAMLASLARSRDEQQRLIEDAGHELRTPLTSLRTNVSVVRRMDELSSSARATLLDDLTTETRELTDLVNELVELATDRRETEPATEVDLSAVADAVAERVQRRTGRPIEVRGDHGIVVGRSKTLERAIANLVENAVKFDPRGDAPIEVVVLGGRVEVLDRGPGIAAADLPHVFDRFYRATSARSRPGSGLGLSIVRDVAIAHDGSVFAAARSGGGASVGFTVGS
jgi:two-component system, OmpR family, sensor histidine kinase MprB